MDYVIIVAGGKGLRMGSEIPKQFLPVAGKPILMRTIERFHEYNPALNIILVLPESQQAYWHQLCEEHHFDIKHQIANGGDTRFQSSKNGLALIPDDEDGVVGIHDGVDRRMFRDGSRRICSHPCICRNRHPALYRPARRRKERAAQRLPRGADSPNLRHRSGKAGFQPGIQGTVYR